MADRLISVPAARSHIDAVVVDPILKACMHNVLDGLPAVDAVPVVRCKDCKYAEKDGIHQVSLKCTRFRTGSFTHRMQPDDFCAYGEAV